MNLFFIKNQWNVGSKCKPPRHFLQYTLIGVSYVTIVIFLPTKKARLNGPPKYLERARKAYKRFLGALEKKVSAQNMRFCQNILTWLWASFLKILKFFCFLWHIIWLVCRMVTIFLLGVRKAYKTFSRGTSKKMFQLKTWGFITIF